MFNRKIFISGLSILSALSLIGGATFAYFSDSGTSTGNTFSSGTFDLRLGNGVAAVSDGVTATWTGSGLAPGGTPILATLNLRNAGTVLGNHVHIAAANTVTVDASPSENDGSMAKHMKITTFTYDGLPVVIPETNANGYADLEDLQSGGVGLYLGGLLDTGVDHSLVMAVQLASDANNTYQGDTLNTDFTITLEQDASQTP